uniref:Uncharacterized protein n=1 Tax=Timema poppense TaxID=170557 RepID=A0A7R9DGX1_TIMPO|nr:unnamed protein product [Timema poppensis]
MDRIRIEGSNTGDFTTEELSVAMLLLVKLVQCQGFIKEIARLEARNPCHGKLAGYDLSYFTPYYYYYYYYYYYPHCPPPTPTFAKQCGALVKGSIRTVHNPSSCLGAPLFSAYSISPDSSFSFSLCVWLSEITIFNNISLQSRLVGFPSDGKLAVAPKGIASYLHDPSFLVKFSMNMIMRKLNSQPFVHLTVNDYFWNNTDPLITLGRDLLPFMVPDENLGILNMIYKNFTDEVTVHIGPQNAERYFTMDRFHGRDRFGFWDQFSCDTVKGATEGISYHQNIKKNDTLLYFRKTICRVATVYYVGKVH